MPSFVFFNGTGCWKSSPCRYDYTGTDKKFFQSSRLKQPYWCKIPFYGWNAVHWQGDALKCVAVQLPTNTGCIPVSHCLGRGGMACMNLSNLFVCMATVLRCSNDQFAGMWLNKMKMWSLTINLLRWFDISVNRLIKTINLKWWNSKNWNQLIIMKNICHSSSPPLQPWQVQRL